MFFFDDTERGWGWGGEASARKGLDGKVLIVGGLDIF